MNQQQWNGELKGENYDQAWSMVHFLAHGEDGRYRKAFAKFMNLIGHGTPWKNAWDQSFGDPRGFEERWRKYWLDLPENPTIELYAQVVVATLTSFLARATVEHQTFDSFADFKSAAKTGELKQSKDDFLPAALLSDALQAVDHSEGFQWEIETTKSRQPVVVLTTPEKTRLVGSFKLQRSKVKSVVVNIDDLSQIIERAGALIKDRKKEQASQLLRDGLRKNSNSPFAEDAKKLLAETK